MTSSKGRYFHASVSFRMGRYFRGSIRYFRGAVTFGVEGALLSEFYGMLSFLKNTCILTFFGILHRFLAKFYFVSVLNAFGICEETKTIVNEINHTKKETKTSQNKEFTETEFYKPKQTRF